MGIGAELVVIEAEPPVDVGDIVVKLIEVLEVETTACVDVVLVPLIGWQPAGIPFEGVSNESAPRLRKEPSSTLSIIEA